MLNTTIFDILKGIMDYVDEAMEFTSELIANVSGANPVTIRKGIAMFCELGIFIILAIKLLKLVLPVYFVYRVAKWIYKTYITEVKYNPNNVHVRRNRFWK